MGKTLRYSSCSCSVRMLATSSGNWMRCCRSMSSLLIPATLEASTLEPAIAVHAWRSETKQYKIHWALPATLGPCCAKERPLGILVLLNCSFISSAIHYILDTFFLFKHPNMFFDVGFFCLSLYLILVR